jgi:phosphatidylinositol-3-phosphatase
VARWLPRGVIIATIAAQVFAVAPSVAPAVGSSMAPRPAGATAAIPAHVVVIVMENKEYGTVIGSKSAPYLNRLARRSVLLSGHYAITHPSLPNYLALTGGSTFGIDSDCTTCSVHRTNIVDQLEAAHISWRAYMQSMPRSCYKGASDGDYAKKHDPFMYYTDISSSKTRCGKVVPFTRFPAALRNGLPGFSWITPNLCFDMHDCSIAKGDGFLHRWVPKIENHLGSNGIVIVVFDEGTSDDGCCQLGSAGGHVAAIIAGPGAASKKHTAASDHYSLLRLIEDAFGLKRLRHARDGSTPTIRHWRS